MVDRRPSSSGASRLLVRSLARSLALGLIIPFLPRAFLWSSSSWTSWTSEEEEDVAVCVAADDVVVQDDHWLAGCPITERKRAARKVRTYSLFLLLLQVQEICVSVEGGHKFLSFSLQRCPLTHLITHSLTWPILTHNNEGPRPRPTDRRPLYTRDLPWQLREAGAQEAANPNANAATLLHCCI